MTDMANLIIKDGRIIDPSQRLDTLGDLVITQGRIAAVITDGTLPYEALDYPVLEAGGLIVCPGFVDLHCHLREPGFEEKETIATGTRAAAKGGFTTVCCMPNTNPTIDTRATVEYVQRVSQEQGVVRVLPIGCITKGQRGEELAEMGELAGAGVVAFSDDGHPVANSRIMRHAMEYSRAFGLPIIDHCEDPALADGGAMNEGPLAARLGLKGIPAAAEEIMVARDVVLAELTGARLHLAHLSTAGSVEMVRRAKDRGLMVTAEVTPTHLTVTEDWVMDHGPIYNTNTKVNPPIRTQKDVEALIQGLLDGAIDAIATDHAPHTWEDKACEYAYATFGISCLETALGSVLSLVHNARLDLNTLISKMTVEPARIIGRSAPSGLGTLKVGAPGDVTIFDPDAQWVVDPASFLSKGKNTPLSGVTLKGRVTATVVGGEVVFQDKQLGRR